MSICSLGSTKVLVGPAQIHCCPCQLSREIESARLTSVLFSNRDTGKTGSGVDVVVDTHAIVRSNRLTIYSLRLLHYATMHLG